MEEWKDIQNFEGLYQVSSYGRIKSLHKGEHILSQGFTGRRNERAVINLCKEGYCKTTIVYRLVAQAFLENPENKRTVNHKDGNPLNNHINNLEWMTHSENTQHAHDAGLLLKRAKVYSKITKKTTYKLIQPNGIIWIIKGNLGTFNTWMNIGTISHLLRALKNFGYCRSCHGWTGSITERKFLTTIDSQGTTWTQKHKSN